MTQQPPDRLGAVEALAQQNTQAIAQLQETMREATQMQAVTASRLSDNLITLTGFMEQLANDQVESGARFEIAIASIDHNFAMIHQDLTEIRDRLPP